MNLKWSYDVRNKQWWVKSNTDYLIAKEDGKYVLTRNYFNTLGRFKKLISAKTVAELLIGEE